MKKKSQVKPLFDIDNTDSEAMNDDNVYPLPVTPIELIGYAKNNIVEAIEQSKDLPIEYEDELLQAYALLNSVQECLFNH